MSTRLLIATALLATALLAAAAPAADAPCGDDIRRFCEGKSPIEVLSCLQGHQPDLSDACKQRIDRVAADLQNAQLDCEEDAFGFCRDAGPGEAMATCLSKHQGKLTRRCQAVFDDFARREAASKDVCGSDARRLCPDKKPGKGDVHLCLLFHGKDVSPACHKALGR
jgi:hypothetical protein